MLKIKALNRESSSDEDAPVIRREAQEGIALELYNKALSLQAQGVFLESESILLKLIDDNIPLLENNGGLPKSMSNLKYSCHVNIGNIYLKLDRVNDALERFLLASELDSTDVTLWYKIGNLSFNECKFRQSAYAFAKGLECSESHWPCLDKLISVLFAIRDTIPCLEYIGKALILDPDYTKGLVLRKQIYKDNPATKEYYKLYNPESVWEPPLNIPINEEDENKYLNEAQILRDKVNEIEKSFAPKPLQTIALPKTLAEYTWLCLTETIIFIHQYLTDNELSHFTMFDMSKSMNLVEEGAFKFPLTEPAEELKPPEEKNDSKTINVNSETVDEDKLNNEQIIERRVSQNSETAMETQEGTPVQTDNDEEQNMEQDTDQEEERKKRGRPTGTKRKRDVLSDLQTWGWYSRRKLSKKAKEKDFTVEDAFERIIPKKYLPYRIDPEKFNNFEDSMCTMDIYNLYMQSSSVSYLSPIHSPKSVNYEQYFSTDKEKDDVQLFWTKTRECVDAVVLIKDLMFHLSKLWHYKWPKELVPLYIKAYNMFREHYDPPQLFSGGHTFEELRNDALASLLFGELSFFSSENEEPIPPTLLGYLRLISGWEEQWKEEYPLIFIRVFWFQAHLFRKENSNDLAVNSLKLIQEAIEEEELKIKEKFMLSLPNCFKCSLINIDITEKILKHLDMIQSLGTIENLYNLEKYEEVADILKSTFNAGPFPQIGRMGRPAQLGILIHSLWYTDLTECFIWTEECLNEGFDQYTKISKEKDKWEKVIEKCLAVLYEIIKSNTVCVIDYLQEDKRARLIQNLAKIISKQLNSEGMRPFCIITPWILLHFVLLREEQREDAKMRIKKGKKEKIDLSSDNFENLDETIPPSIDILYSAHEFLGPKGWCTLNQGELLHFIIDTVLDKLDTPIFERLRKKLDVHVEQSMFCLYQHPSKKNKISRHLADHNVDPLSLSWERAAQLFEFFGPDSLPEFNSYKKASISSDLELLLKRIIALVPPNYAPQHHLPKIMDYIHGKTDKIMDPVDFPHKVKAIYYLIGDFYFKQREFGKCIKYFQMDLCLNPDRLDSWACLGLSYASQLDTKLNHCEKFKSEMEFLEKAKYATICFTKALEICPDPLMLWIECGTFQYTVHSYCSRIMKFESENLSMEKFEFLENQKNTYLDSSGNSFEKAIAIYEMEDTNEPDERWLQYYILGKIAEKKQKEPSEYLQYYLTASTLLEENQAEYPEKINYNNPQHLSVEALELHYRIHASVLKYLELHEGKEIPSILGAFFKKCLNGSKFLKKPSPVTAPAPATTSETTNVAESVQPTESPVKNTNFQEPFIDGINKLDSADLKEESLTDNTSNNKNENPENIAQNEISVANKITCENSTTANTNKIEDLIIDVEKDLVNPNKSNDIIILSDSDDDIKIEDELIQNVKESTDNNIKNEDNSSVTVNKDNVSNNTNHCEEKMDVVDDNDIKTEKTIEETNTDNTHKEEESKQMNVNTNNQINCSPNDDPITIEDEVNGDKVQDVQKLLDEMMVKTMKETEELQNEVDSDLSGTEKIEEVILKDENEQENTEINETKAETAMETEPIKPKDDHPDSDSKKVSAEDSSSGSSSSSSSSDSSDSDSDDDADSSSSSSSSSDGNNEFMSHSEISHLIDKCIFGLEICIVRLTQNYKALYRLAHLYFNYKTKKDLTKCKQLLLSDYKCKDGTVISGLFSDRKPTNFFNGIWRIPSSEIDRPGSLSAHMSRCLSLLLQILRTTNDNKTLIDLSVQLRKPPDPDKVYIKDSERTQFSDQALTMCIQSLKSQIKHVSTMSNPQIAKLLQEIFKIYQRLQKEVPGKESQFAQVLTEVYRQFIKEKIPENANVLELAVKFCLQNKAAEKHKSPGSSKTLNLTPRGSGATSATPVMPSPQSVGQSPSFVLKRPGTSRPRGRPPLQKVPGQPRYQRPKNTSQAGLPKSYSWQKSLMDQSYAYEYVKHYQDELIKQYSQNLSIAQLTQLSQILSQGNNLMTATAITNQMLAQTGLLNSNLVKQMNTLGGPSHSSSTQLMDSLNQLNPNMKKKLGVDQALSSLTTDQLKLLGTLIPKQGSGNSTAQSKPPTSLTTTSSSGVVTSKTNKQASVSRQNLMNTTTKTTYTDPSKSKPTTIVSLPQNIQSSPIFKEPITKVANQDDKNPKDLMKDRPNISIIPVSVSLPPPPSVSPSFIRPTSTSPSSGKTLQEILAEKKKEQHNKQMKTNADGDKLHTDALMKSLNITSIPSSLTVSPSQSIMSTPSIKNSDTGATIYSKTYSKTITTTTKYSSDNSVQSPTSLNIPQEQSLPSSLTMSKASSSSLRGSAVSFPMDASVSISQVRSKKPKHKSIVTNNNNNVVNVLSITKKRKQDLKRKSTEPKTLVVPKQINILNRTSHTKKPVDFTKVLHDNKKLQQSSKTDTIKNIKSEIKPQQPTKSDTIQKLQSEISNRFNISKLDSTLESSKTLEMLSKSGVSIKTYTKKSVDITKPETSIVRISPDKIKSKSPKIDHLTESELPKKKSTDLPSDEVIFID